MSILLSWHIPSVSIPGLLFFRCGLSRLCVYTRIVSRVRAASLLSIDVYARWTILQAAVEHAVVQISNTASWQYRVRSGRPLSVPSSEACERPTLLVLIGSRAREREKMHLVRGCLSIPAQRAPESTDSYFRTA